MSEISRVLFIGASAGGITALQRLLGFLSTDFLAPIVTVQHLPAQAHVRSTLVYGRHTSRKLVEVFDKTKLEKNCVYFAPPDYHTLVERDLTLSLSRDEPLNYSRPSIDVLFESAALNLRGKACGILLTGANSDGALGLKLIKDHGGYAIVQDPAEAEIPAMPNSALAIMEPHFVGSLENIARHVEALMRAGFE